MALEDKDFIIRQVQQLAEGIGKFLDKESIKELIHYDQSQDETLMDDEIEMILLITDVKEIQEVNKLSQKDIARELGITEMDLEKLYNHERFADSTELKAIQEFVDQYTH